LKENFPDIKPQFLQVNPRWTDHSATVAIGTEIDPFLNIPELFRGKFLAGGKCPDGGNFLRGENIDIGNPLEGDSNGALRTAGSAMHTGIEFHQLYHRQMLSHPGFGETFHINY
jgi:hypothetical protein